MRFLLALLFLIPIDAYAQANKFAYGIGAFQGMFQAGVTREYESISFDAGFGYTPNLNGYPDVYQLNLKTRFYFSLGDSIKTGPEAFLLYSLGKDQWLHQPPQYPDKYYTPTALLFGAGWTVVGEISETVDIYYELVTLDAYAETYVRSEGTLDIQDIFTWGIGLRQKI